MSTSQKQSAALIRLTPQGRGAIATVLIRGEKNVSRILRHFNRPSVNGPSSKGHCLRPNQPVFGRLLLGDTGRENFSEEVILHQSNPDTLELHTHGSEQVLRLIEQLLEPETLVDWKTGLEQNELRSFFQTVSPCSVSKPESEESWQDSSLQRQIAKTALLLLPFAKTERAAQILLDQYNGALFCELQAIKTATSEEAKRRRDRLEENRWVGEHLVKPFTVVLIGRPNSGKSSLLNALLGFNRAIVDSTAGTTRDVLDAETAIDGWPIRLLDTAGVRQTENPIEQEGMSKGAAVLKTADLVLHLVDLSVDRSRNDSESFSPQNNTRSPKRPQPVLTVYTKCDQPIVQERLQSFIQPLMVSVLDGTGLENLTREIVKGLIPNPPRFLEAVPIMPVMSKTGCVPHEQNFPPLEGY